MLNHFKEYQDTYVLYKQIDSTNSFGETIETNDTAIDIEAYKHKSKNSQQGEKGLDYSKKEYIFYSNTTEQLDRGDILEKDGKKYEIKDVLDSVGGFIKITCVSNV